MTSGGRWVEVAPARLDKWLTGFGERHGDTDVDVSSETVLLRAADGAQASIEVPFPPLVVTAGTAYGGLVAHAQRPRVIGLLLVRRGGYAAGVVERGRLSSSKVGSRHVQGRSAAGGWSQQRFARRREGQTREAVGAAADTAARILGAQAHRIDAVVTGGDRAMVAAVLEDSRLSALRGRVVDRFLPLPDPRRAVLDSAVPQSMAVRIHINDAAQ